MNDSPAALGQATHRTKVFAATKWTTVSFVVSFVAQFLQYVVLARLLHQSELGLVAVVTLVSGFADIFLRMGLSQAVIQRSRLTSRELSSLFWLNMIIATTVSLLVAAASFAVAAFFEAPDAAPLLQVASFTFIVGGLSQIHRAMLEKRLDFKSVGIIESVSALAMLAGTVLFALLDMQALSGVLGILLGALVRTILFVIAGSRLFRPRLRFRFGDTKRFVSFGMMQTLDSVLTYASSSASTAATGRTLGTSALGGFNLAVNAAVNMPGRINPIITRVMFPYFSLIQMDRKKMATDYLKVMTALGAISVPALTALALASGNFVEVVYGERWAWIAPLISLLAVVGMLRAVGNPVGFLVQATDNLRMSVIMNALKAVVTVPCVFIGAAMGGVHGAAYALIGTQLFSFLLTYVVVRRILRIGFGDYLRPLAVSVGLALPLLIVMALTTFVANRVFDDALPSLLLQVGLGAAVLAATFLLSRNDTVAQVRQIMLRRVKR